MLNRHPPQITARVEKEEGGTYVTLRVRLGDPRVSRSGQTIVWAGTNADFVAAGDATLDGHPVKVKLCIVTALRNPLPPGAPPTWDKHHGKR